jgi:hypothetical protein
VGELTATLSSRELTEWQAFATLESLGDQRADLRMAIVCSTFANIHRGKRKKAFTPRDFMPFIERARKDEALQADVKAVMAKLGVG